MKHYLITDPWKIIEREFHPEYQKNSESIFSIGNGRMGGRANFEEGYGGEHLLGNYISGIYYPDKTRVGWWKIGYPEYYAKVLNAAHWSGVEIYINGRKLDLFACKLHAFSRILHMDRGYLERTVSLETPDGVCLELHCIRFLSMAWDEGGAMQFYLTSLTDHVQIRFVSYCNFDVRNEDANYAEDFWEGVLEQRSGNAMVLQAKTKKTGFSVATGIFNAFHLNGSPLQTEYATELKPRYGSQSVDLMLQSGDCLSLEKSVCQISSLDYSEDQLAEICFEKLSWWSRIAFDQRLADQNAYWQGIWNRADICIEGDDEAQQGIRFNIFHVFQTYTGKDPRLNIGPKGFTGERYGGATYWDTEAYCLPFYLGTAPATVARQLLKYRYKQLPQAILNASKLGFKNGAALYPMVTMNGEECHNEWEITFEEIHRNGALVYALYEYTRTTQDYEYLYTYGLPVIIAINRFWVQRVHWSVPKSKFVMHGVTGPNEYENNVNNNWYTLYLAKWCIEYGLEVLDRMPHDSEQKRTLLQQEKLSPEELEHWKQVASEMYLPQSHELGIFLQQDDYLDKDLLTVDDLDAEQLPLNQHWSWDRILRSCFIKQADVLQGLFFFKDHFTIDVIRNNFNFYEPRTVHESSLSPCVHSILASWLDKMDKAYALFIRASRYDLIDFNEDTCDGLHITSMAGSWMAVVKGFAGLELTGNQVSLRPRLPEHWKSLGFSFICQGERVEVNYNREFLRIQNMGRKAITLLLNDTDFHLDGFQERTIKRIPS